MHCRIHRYCIYGQKKESIAEMSERALGETLFFYANLMIYGKEEILYNVYRILFNFI
jgi:hypothetical protein